MAHSSNDTEASFCWAGGVSRKGQTVAIYLYIYIYIYVHVKQINALSMHNEDTDYDNNGDDDDRGKDGADAIADELSDELTRLICFMR